MNTDRLRELYRRWSALEDDKADIAGDLSALFAEAKVDRFNPKALRAAFRRARNIDRKGDEARQADAEADDYLAALLDVGTQVATRAGAMPPHDPETGEVHETEPGEGGVTASVPASPAAPSVPSAGGAFDQMPEIPDYLRRTRAA